MRQKRTTADPTTVQCDQHMGEKAPLSRAISTRPTPLHAMGQAYDKDRNKILNLACAVGNPVTIQTGNTSANVNVDYNLSYEKLYNKIQGIGSLDVSFSAVKAGVQVDAALENAATNLCPSSPTASCPARWKT